MLKPVRLFLFGICMGIADLIPGISGGTVAFMGGIYDEFLAALKSVKFQPLRQIQFGFLLPLGSGILLSILLLSQIFYQLLAHPSYATCLYAFFFGAVLASVYFCGRQANWRQVSSWILFSVGALLAFFCSGNVTLKADSSFHPLFVLFAGSLATFAMLLPGISGSYVLTLLGVYPVAIKALADISSGLSILTPLVIGILFGLCFFARVVSFLLSIAKSHCIAFLSGCMLGGLRAIYPFGQAGGLALPISCLALGLIIVILLELRRDLKINLDRVE